MQRFPRQALLVPVFLALLAIPAIMDFRSAGRTREAIDPISRYGFKLAEVANTAGIDFVHCGPTFDPQLGHIMPQVAAMGAGVSIVDFNRDGWQDVYVTNSRVGSANRLYRNEQDGTFRDVAVETGVADVNRMNTGVSTGAVWGDYDNDGYEDLFLYKYGRPELYRNQNGVRFRRVTDQTGFTPWVNANAAVWLDYDRDGLLDLFLAGYWDERVDLWNLETTRVMPESFEYAENGGRNYLYRNQGDGTFRDVTTELGLGNRRWSLAVGAADLFGTGFPDLFIANDYGVSELYLNDEGRQFVDVGKQTGIAQVPKSGMNAAFGDVFNQGALSIYETNISEPGVLVQGNNLWVPRRGTSGEPVEFDNLASSMGVHLGGWSWGAQFADVNNDGTLDIYLVNGYVSADTQTSYWYDFSEIAVGHRAIISDAKNWPAMNGRSLSGYQQKRIWLNDGLGRFTEVAQVVGATDRYDGRAVVVADLWNRGVLDVVVANQRGPLLVYKNTVAAERAWVAFDLEGSASNRSAIGAQVRLYWDGRQQVQEVSGGSGFSAQNQRPVHFGLGATRQIERVEIRWPSGRLQTIEAPTSNTLHRIREPE